MCQARLGVGTSLLLSSSVYAIPLQLGEPVTVLRASDLLSPGLLRGPHHRVGERVLNDGCLNIYTLYTEYGRMQVVSTPMLRKRIGEMNAIAFMEQVDPPERVQEGVFEAGRGVAESVQDLAADPNATLQGAGRGVAHLFDLAGEHLLSEPSDVEGSALAGLVGLAGCKRDVARELGVDVYSANPVLQERLDQITYARYGGKVSLSALKIMIPGGVGAAISMTGGAKFLKDVVASASPLTLRGLNRSKLERMNIDPTLIDGFINHTAFTPRDQTYLVAALDQMKDTRNRGEFLRLAMRVNDRALTSHPARLACLYAGYDRTQAHLLRFLSLGPFLIAQTREAAVLISAADQLIGDRRAHRVYQMLRLQAMRATGTERTELWVPGAIDPRSRHLFEADGWRVFERCESRLLKGTTSNW
jgi:hypothetical protein